MDKPNSDPSILTIAGRTFMLIALILIGVASYTIIRSSAKKKSAS